MYLFKAEVYFSINGESTESDRVNPFTLKEWCIVGYNSCNVYIMPEHGEECEWLFPKSHSATLQCLSFGPLPQDIKFAVTEE